MAIVATKFEMSVSIVDNGGNPTSTTLELRGADYAAAAANAGAIITALTAVTDGVIVGYRLAEVYEETGTVTLPAVGVNSAESASITVGVAGAGLKKANIRIPIPKQAVFVGTSGADTNIVNLSATIVNNYVDLFRSGGHAYVSDGETAGASLAGVRVTRTKRGN